MIYKHYDPEALNRQYNNRLQTPAFATHFENYERLNLIASQHQPVFRDIAYGSGDRQKVDIYPSNIPGSTTLIFIHGGYWQALDKSGFQFVGAAFQPNDITVVLINYPLAPSASMDEIVTSCESALQWTFDHINEYNGDADKLFIAGHSAGGHLAALLLLRNNRIKAAFALSAIFNLIPIQRSNINDAIKMDEATALKNSPVHSQPLEDAQILVAVGSEESDEFKSQSRELQESWKHTSAVTLLEIPDGNHYSIVEIFADRTSTLHEAALALMKT